MSALTINVLNNELTDETFPQFVGITPPISFDEPIHHIIEFTVNYRTISGNHTNSIELKVEFDASGYINNLYYPCLIMGNNWEDGLVYTYDLSRFGVLSNVSGYYKVYYDGSLQSNTSITSSNINTYNSLTRNITMFDTFSITVEHCTIPIIYQVQGVELYGYNPNIYYRSQWELLTISTGFDYEKCLNFKQAEELKEYYYYGQAEQYTVDEFGTITQTSATPIYRGIRIKSNKRCSLYEIAGIQDGVLKMGMNLQGIAIAYYSTDNGETWQNMTGQPTSLPWDYLYRNWHNEKGTFYAYSVNDAKIQTNMFIYETKEESDEYNSGGDNERDAINYDDISTDEPPSNETGEEDDETEFGTIGIRSIFSQQYIMSESALSEVANAFFDVTQGGITGIFEDIKKGCEMYGDSVADDIESLYFYPVNLNTVFSSGIMSQNYIYFGGYRFAMNNSVNKILFPNGYYDFGSFVIETTFGNNIRSYEPYTKLYCYLAYIGWVQLDMKKYLHKTVNIRYYIDTRCGGCVAVLIANGVMCDFFNGQIGVSMPIKATDFNAYANAQIQTLLGFGKGMTGQGENAMNVGKEMTKAGSVAGDVIGGMGAIGLLGAGIQGTKTLYGLTQNNINNFNHTIGGSSSMLNMFLPQECCFMFEVQEAIPTEYERELVGLPSNASGTVGSFTGYLECEQVNLVCSGATAKEQSEILRYLYGGIYI